ncbi:hypothetical protein HMPREF9999_00543 [Alloprevotella sp. oral taxon 473 str. F0040]|nr:hypothetical protein HMPREF9999_00543 [Alloprevotella sp. oral taxon 473 str. F0040]
MRRKVSDICLEISKKKWKMSESLPTHRRVIEKRGYLLAPKSPKRGRRKRRVNES